jgi:hypothetical protein
MHDQHLGLVDLVAVADLVVLEAVVGPTVHNQLAFTGLAEASASAPLHDLRPLVLGELIEDAVGKLSLRGVVAPILESA